MKMSFNKSKYTKKPDTSAGIAESHRQFLHRFNFDNKYKAEEPVTKRTRSGPTLKSHGFIFEEDEKATNKTQEEVETEEKSVSAVAFPSYNKGEWYSLKGRIGRIHLLAYSSLVGLLFITISFAAFTATSGVANNSMQLQSGNWSILLTTLLILSFPTYFYTLVVYPRRRLHDIGKSGLWLLLYFLPPISLFLLYLLYIKKGEEGSNKYGLPPQPNTGVEKTLAVLLTFGFGFAILVVAFAPKICLDNLGQKVPTSQLQGIEDYLNGQKVIIQETIEEDGAKDLILDNNMENEASQSNAILLNTNPEADPEVQQAIEEALNNPVQDESKVEMETEVEAVQIPEEPVESNEIVINSANPDTDYYEFLQASETPLHIESEKPKTLSEEMRELNLDEIHVEPEIEPKELNR